MANGKRFVLEGRTTGSGAELTTPRPEAEGRGFRPSPAGVPVSAAAARTGWLPFASYAASAGSRLQPGVSDGNGGVDVPVVPGAAFRAVPSSDAQRHRG